MRALILALFLSSCAPALAVQPKSKPTTPIAVPSIRMTGEEVSDLCLELISVAIQLKSSYAECETADGRLKYEGKK